MPTDEYHLIVVGAGSGGVAAALSATRLGLRVLLVEKSDMLGGNATRCGVNCWEPGVGGTGIPFDIYRRLKRLPLAVGIYSFGRHFMWRRPDEPIPFPGGEQVVDPTKHYLDSLLRHGTRNLSRDEALAYRREKWHGVLFEPDLCAQVMEELLAETGRCTVLKNTAFTRIIMDGRRLAALVLSDGREVSAPFFVDSTANIHLAVACGCETMLGQESQATFGESNAPEEPNDRLNGVTLIYRATPIANRSIEPLPPEIPADCWWAPRFPVAAINHYPNGDLNINMLPTMEGREAFDMGFEASYAECTRRVYAHWHHNQMTFPEFQGYRLLRIAPGLGVREARRVVGRAILTQHDLMAGLNRQEHSDIIAIADHAMDTHGASTGRAGTREHDQPYGVPYRCLLPRDVDNLLVACRGASFSSVAASSCRLSRTMMQLGQAAGTAAALALDQEVDLADVPPTALQDRLRDQHVSLEWPMPAQLVAHLMNEDEDSRR
ncbi:MAG: FAD-dependent oxidoreductase [Anaerolineae bacterium]|jgi:hypothetical protein|nr:FAD-dependent oxidoreductase [Anaerolineae bacterium]